MQEIVVEFLELLKKENLVNSNFKVDFTSIEFYNQSLFPIYITKPNHSYCVKIISNREMAKAEFLSLQFLYEKGIKVPKPFFLWESKNRSFLVMEFISTGSRKNPKALLETLLPLYSHQSPTWGFAFSNFIGTLEQPNHETKDFSEYFWKDRWLAQIQPAFQAGILSKSHIQNLEKVFQNSLSWGISQIQPRLIHGDLWSGNLIWSKDGDAYLIDPSLSFGHPEQDLAMANLFGGFPENVFPEILQGSGLDFQGYQKRIPYWQIYPLLVHVNIFGRSYLAQLETVIKQSLWN